VSALLDHALHALSNDPILQGIVAIICSLILEDPTILAVALLVADGSMEYSTALVSMSIGIGIGDWALYLAGRYLGPHLVRWKLVSQARLDRIRVWFDENMFTAILVSRFVPGLRLPANVAAGMSRASPRTYMPSALFASLVWTLVVLTLVSRVGSAILPVLGDLKWPAVVALIIFVMYMQRRSYKQMAVDPESATAEEAPASFFEFWHPWIFYSPVVLFYIALAIRYRSLTLPTAVNPRIYSGGMILESKSQILDLVPAQSRQWIAPHTTYNYVDDGRPVDAHVEAALAAIAAAGIALPIVAKPDLGQRGAGVRPVRNAGDLHSFFESFPRDTLVVLQTLAPYDHEAGIMYYRMPHERRGRIISITLKEFPFVVGNGQRTLRELIMANDRARLISEVYFKRHEKTLARILAQGEKFPLVFAGNHAQGCIFKDGLHVLTPALSARIDEIAQSIPQYYFGRFDIRFRDLESFQRGEGFLIVEINGAGAEATHIWDADATLSDAYRTLFEQFRILFRIGDENRRSGHRPIGPIQFLNDVLVYQRLARKYPMAG
jgi:membrane protein DedA with SNARE-associated domain